MPSLSEISDAELDALIAAKRPQAQRGKPITELTDDELDAAIAAKQPKSWGDTAIDVAKSIPTGIAKGVAAIPGIPGDLQALGDLAGREIARHTAGRVKNLVVKGTWDAPTGEEMEAMRAASLQRAHEAAPWMPDVRNLPKPADYGSAYFINKAKKAGVPFHKPETTAGRYMENVAAFAPTALLGPGSLGKKLVGYAVAPGVASEAAGQATEGTSFEPWARIAGGLLGGGLTPALKAALTPFRGIANPTGATREYIANLLKKAKMDPSKVEEALAAAAREGQPEFAVADALGTPGQRATAMVTRSDSDSRFPLIEQFERRQGDQARRVVSHIEDGIGTPQTAEQYRTALEQQRRAEGRTNYDAARAAAGDVDVDPVLAAIDDHLGLRPQAAAPMAVRTPEPTLRDKPATLRTLERLQVEEAKGQLTGITKRVADVLAGRATIPSPPSFVDYVKRKGGIRADQGDLESIFGKGSVPPGLRNSKGLAPDQMARSLRQDFPEHFGGREDPMLPHDGKDLDLMYDYLQQASHGGDLPWFSQATMKSDDYTVMTTANRLLQQADKVGARIESRADAARFIEGEPQYGARPPEPSLSGPLPKSYLDQLGGEATDVAAKQQEMLAQTPIQARLQTIRNMLATPDGKIKASDYPTALAIKTSLGDELMAARRAGEANKARVLGGIVDELEKALEAASAPHKAANDLYAAQSRNIEGVDMGAKRIGRGRAADNITTFNALSDAEKDAFRSGAASKLIERVERAPEGSNKVRPLLTDAYQQEFPVFARPGMAQQLDRQLRREQTMFDTRQAATGGSRKSDNLVDTNAALQSSVVNQLLRGRPLAAAGTAFMRATELAQGLTPAVRGAVGRALSETDPAKAKKLFDAAVAYARRTNETDRQILNVIGSSMNGFGAVPAQ